MQLVRGLVLVAAGAALFAGSGLLLPGGFGLERSVVVKAPVAVAYRLASTHDGWARWIGTMAEIDPSFEVRPPAGRRDGAGLMFAWDARALGPGRLRLLDAEPESKVAFELLRAGLPFVIRGTVKVERVPEGTRISVSEAGRFGWSPLRRWRAYAKRDAVDRELRDLLAAAKRALDAGWTSAP